ncbi:endonuclease V [Cognatilysobacter bugurensis]|uniref:endonuclease V n=1 Tax=Cognatilysobacter bugurensis TaxID=543356 RepID=UPI001E5FFF02|nr:endonuclease V [Lysobacter bugurensis]
MINATWPRAGLAGWDGTEGGARALQCTLAGEVELGDGFRPTLTTVGGFSARTAGDGRRVRAAAVLMDLQTLQPLHVDVREVEAPLPYVRELLGFRALPALLESLDALPYRPEVAFVEGHGIAHPRRCGLASHFGLATGVPTIGVARDRLAGSAPEPGPTPCDATRLREGDQQVGWSVRTCRDARPVFVSPGHRVSLKSALELTLRSLQAQRLPRPVDLAHELAHEPGGTGPRRWHPGARSGPSLHT